MSDCKLLVTLELVIQVISLHYIWGWIIFSKWYESDKC